MCAILGWNGPITRSLLRELYRNSAMWGPHAVGLAYVDECGTRTFKRAVHPDTFLRNCNHRLNRAADYHVGFGHVRWASVGMPHGDACAHPFVFKNIVFAHNGTLNPSWKTISKPLMPLALTDSHALGPYIDMRKPSYLPGPKGLIWLQNDNLYAYRLQQRLTAITIQWHASMVTSFSDKSLLNMDISREEAEEGLVGPLTTTIVVTHANILLASRTVQLGMADVAERHELVAGHAYRVLPDGVEEAWVDVDVQDTASSDLARPVCGYAGG